MRPDVTATVAAVNAIEVVNAVNAMPYDTVASVHVDSIHGQHVETSGLKFGDRPGQWRKEKSGKCRHYGIGDYSYTGERGRRQGADGRMVLEAVRNWHGGVLPCDSRNATSDPHHYETTDKESESTQERRYNGNEYTRYRSIWDNKVFNGSGWTRNSYLDSLWYPDN
jgi:hypothetical protein